MTDVSLKDIKSGYNLNKINDNFETIEDVINDEIIHTTGGNNVMSQDLDMNNNKILNLPAPSSPTEPLRKGDVTLDTTGATVQYVDDKIDTVVKDSPTLNHAIARTDAIEGGAVNVAEHNRS